MEVVATAMVVAIPLALVVDESSSPGVNMIPQFEDICR